MSDVVFFVPWLLNLMLIALLLQQASHVRAANRRADGYKEIALQWQAAARNSVAALERISDTPPSPMNPGAESVHSGKQNTADKSELLPTQLPKADL